MLSGISGFHSYYSMYPYSRLAYGRVSGRGAQVQGAASAAGAAQVRGAVREFILRKNRTPGLP